MFWPNVLFHQTVTENIPAKFQHGLRESKNQCWESDFAFHKENECEYWNGSLWSISKRFRLDNLRIYHNI